MLNCLPGVRKTFGTSADMSGQFVTGAEMSYGHFGTSARNVLGTKCPGSKVS